MYLYKESKQTKCAILMQTFFILANACTDTQRSLNETKDNMSVNPSTNVNRVCQFITHVHKICQILTNIAAHISLLKAYSSLINHCNSLY